MTKKAELVKKMRTLGVTGKIIDGMEWGDLQHATLVMGELNHINDFPAFDTYNEFGSHPEGIYYKLKKLLEKAGWEWDWYDAGTVILYPDNL